MVRIALATEDRYPDGLEDDAPALDLLRARGVEPLYVSWEDPRVNWASFDAVVIRGTWNYTLRYSAFLAWLDSVPVPIWNRREILHWNTDKRYLFDLARRGVPIIPTALWSPSRDLGAAMAEHGWTQAVLKPVVGAGARDTWRFAADEAADVQRRLTLNEVMLLQPFVPEIAENGEWSLLFFDGAYSHAVLKRAAPGDFRVQEDHGGEVIFAAASDALITAGQRVLDAVDQDLLYARIDLVDTPAGPLLVEAELVEPELFLRAHPAAPARFAAAVARRCQS